MPTIERLGSDLEKYTFVNDDEPTRPLLQIARCDFNRRILISY